MTLRELITKIGFSVDLSGLSRYDQAIGRAMTQTRALANNIGELGGKMQRIGAVGTLAVSVPMAMIAKSSLQFMNNIDNINIDFKSLLGSAEQAKTTLDELFKYEARTPFNLDEVMRFSKSLMLAKIPAQDLTQWLTLMGDATLGNNEYMDRTIYQFGQIQNRGYAMTDEMNRFAEAMVPMRDTLKNMLNVDGAQLEKMLATHKITPAIIMRAFERIGAERAGSMDAKAKTLGGLWSSFESSTMRVKLQIGRILSDSLHLPKIVSLATKAMNVLADKLEKLSPKMKKLFAFAGLGAFVFFPAIAALGTILKLVGGISWAFRLLAGMGGIARLVTVLRSVGVAMLAVTWQVALIGVALALIGLIIEDIYAGLHGKESLLIPEWKGMWEDWSAFVVRNADIIVEYWSGVGSSISKFFTDSFDAVRNAVTGAVDFVMGKFNALDAWFYKLPFVQWAIKTNNKMSAALNEATGSNVFSQWNNPAALATPGAGSWKPSQNTGGNTFSVVTGNITIPVPAGTPQSQVDFLSSSMNNIVEQTFTNKINQFFIRGIRAEVKR